MGRETLNRALFIVTVSIFTLAVVFCYKILVAPVLILAVIGWLYNKN